MDITVILAASHGELDRVTLKVGNAGDDRIQLSELVEALREARKDDWMLCDGDQLRILIR